MEHSGHDFKGIYSITGCHLVSHLWVDVTTALHSSLLASLMPPGQLSALCHYFVKLSLNPVTMPGT